jgi:hypothetical protein
MKKEDAHALSFTGKVLDLKYRLRSKAYSKYLRVRSKKKIGAGQGPIILCYPEMPEFYHIIWTIADCLGATITNDPSTKADVILHFEDTTIRANDPILDELHKSKRVLNYNARDISKRRVENVFQEVFGYGMSIDPETHLGLCVRKSNDNARHDGKVIQCPTPREEGYIYQNLVNNQKGKWAIDIRVPIIKGTMPVAWRKHKAINDRFDNLKWADMIDPEVEYTKEEREKILAFAEKFGFECGELDVIRDFESGMIYIIDANNTPASLHPAEQVSWKDYHMIVHKLAERFEEAFLKK